MANRWYHGTRRRIKSKSAWLVLAEVTARSHIAERGDSKQFDTQTEPFSGELVARKIAAEDAIHVKDEVTVHLHGRTTESVRVVNEDLSTADDLHSDGTIEFSMNGRAPQNEEDSIKVGQTLVERMNREGSNWGSVRKTDKPWVDCEASKAGDEKKILEIQVTRVMPESKFKELGSSKHVNGEPGTDELGDDLYRVIKAKPATKEIILALDAVRTPRYAFSAVVDSFRRRYEAESSGFKEIWVVGPSANLTVRLDVP